GTKLGTAFQIADDILGVYSDDESLGKSVMSDLREGKKTLLFLEIDRSLREQDRARFRSLWGCPMATLADLDAVRRWGAESGALDRVRRCADGLIDEAKLAIPRFADRALRDLADHMLARSA